MKFQSASLDVAGMRTQNRTMMLQLVWQARELSRAELARRTGMSRSTVSSLVAELIDAGLVDETGEGTSSGGRRPILLRWRDDAFLIAGIDLGATHVACALTDLRGRVVAWRHVRFDVRENPPGALAQLETLVDACLAETGLPRTRLAGLGVAVPSPVDPANPGRMAPMILPAWAEIDLAEALRARFDLPVVIDNDANLGAIAERWWGAGRSGQDLTFVKLGMGVGAGHILNGEIHRGAHGIAGEFSHVTLGPEGPPCACGQRGCLVRHIGSIAVCARIEAGVRTRPDSVLAEYPPSVDRLVKGAHAGDALALEITAEIAQALGTALVTLLNLLSPACIVLGGQLSLLGPHLLEPVRTHLRQHTLWPALGETPVVITALGQQNIALGAATALLAEVLARPELLPLGQGRLSA